MDGDPEVVPARPLEEAPVLLHPEAVRLRAGDVDADDAAFGPGDRLLDDDRVLARVEGAVHHQDQDRKDPPG